MTTSEDLRRVYADEEPGRLAVGCINGLLFSLPIWGLIILLYRSLR